MKRSDMDSLDLRVLREMQLDGRQSVADLARTLGISRTLATNRLGRLLSQKITRVVAYTTPYALGYRTLAVTGVRVSPGELDAVADKLRSLPNVVTLIIAAGWQDIIVWTMFPNAEGLSAFLAERLGSISGITSTETMMVIEWNVSVPVTFSSGEAKEFFSCPPSLASATRRDGQEERAALTQRRDPAPDMVIDELDLKILREMERDARQSISELARKLHISRGNASDRLNRLLEKQIVRIMAFSNPADLGYPVFVMVGMRVSLQQINSLVGKVEALPNVYWVARVAGRHDVIVGTVFRDLTEVSRFLCKELGTIPGVLSTEIMIGLEIRKSSFAFLASSYLQSIEGHRQ